MKSFTESTNFPVGIVPVGSGGGYAGAGRGVPGASSPTKEPVFYDTVGDVTTTNVTLEDGTELVRKFVRAGTPYHSLLMKHEDGSYHHSDRSGQPCIGSVRTYGHLSNRPYDYFPGDLRTAHRTFPKGNPVVVGFPMKTPHDFAANLFFSKEASPWRELLNKDHEIVKSANGEILGFVLLDTDVDPTLMVSFVRGFRYMYQIRAAITKLGADTSFDKLDPRVQFIAAAVGGNLDGKTWNFFCSQGAPDWARVMAGEILPGLREETFLNRGAYNRPIIEHVFGYDLDIKQNMPTFKDWTEAQDYLINMKIKEYEQPRIL